MLKVSRYFCELMNILTNVHNELLISTENCWLNNLNRFIFFTDQNSIVNSLRFYIFRQLKYSCDIYIYLQG